MRLDAAGKACLIPVITKSYLDNVPGLEIVDG